MTKTEKTPVAVGDVRDDLEAALFEMKRVIVGQEVMLERVLVGLLAGGHLLIEGVPGLAKTLTVKTLADVLDGTFHRIQFTPDLVPSDLVGTRVYRPGTGDFDVELGPVFCNFLLADEINRAPAKVQSALLEVMQERQVTIGATTHAVPDPFLVLATQNPIEAEGTYPLPEAQVDRFMMKVVVDYPDFGDELTVVQRSLAAAPELHSVISADSLRDLQRTAAGVYVDPHVATYAVTLTLATRRPASTTLPTWSASSRTGRARVARSTSCTAPARSRSCAAARTRCLRTSATWRKMSSAIGSCSRTRPWPTR